MSSSNPESLTVSLAAVKTVLPFGRIDFTKARASAAVFTTSTSKLCFRSASAALWIISSEAAFEKA